MQYQFLFGHVILSPEERCRFGPDVLTRVQDPEHMCKLECENALIVDARNNFICSFFYSKRTGMVEYCEPHPSHFWEQPEVIQVMLVELSARARRIVVPRLVCSAEAFYGFEALLDQTGFAIRFDREHYFWVKKIF